MFDKNNDKIWLQTNLREEWPFVHRVARAGQPFKPNFFHFKDKKPFISSSLKLTVNTQDQQTTKLYSIKIKSTICWYQSQKLDNPSVQIKAEAKQTSDYKVNTKHAKIRSRFLI